MYAHPFDHGGRQLILLIRRKTVRRETARQISPPSPAIVADDADAIVRRWGVATRHQGGVRSTAFIPGGKGLISSLFDRALKLQDESGPSASTTGMGGPRGGSSEFGERYNKADSDSLRRGKGRKSMLHLLLLL